MPKAWPNGSIKGLRARGGFEIEMTWKEGELVTALIRSITGTNCRVRYRDKVSALHLKPGTEAKLSKTLIDEG